MQNFRLDKLPQLCIYGQEGMALPSQGSLAQRSGTPRHKIESLGFKRAAVVGSRKENRWR
ncbi:hypothetical protein [[Phormidium] sp. ETS-05]|uniref:hypothetical protein n=1 Tax=[Phormidium] sp. ETS-05 TaxID=222819 RepID=UPI0018EF1FF6|nr:hypothetical protein [[Phormidium] sp. ETS-05]